MPLATCAQKLHARILLISVINQAFKHDVFRHPASFPPHPSKPNGKYQYGQRNRDGDIEPPVLVDSQTLFGAVSDVEEDHAEECLFSILVREIMKGKAGGGLWPQGRGRMEEEDNGKRVVSNIQL